MLCYVMVMTQVVDRRIGRNRTQDAAHQTAEDGEGHDKIRYVTCCVTVYVRGDRNNVVSLNYKKNMIVI